MTKFLLWCALARFSITLISFVKLYSKWPMGICYTPTCAPSDTGRRQFGAMVRLGLKDVVGAVIRDVNNAGVKDITLR